MARMLMLILMALAAFAVVPSTATPAPMPTPTTTSIEPSFTTASAVSEILITVDQAFQDCLPDLMNVTNPEFDGDIFGSVSTAIRAQKIQEAQIPMLRTMLVGDDEQALMNGLTATDSGIDENLNGILIADLRKREAIKEFARKAAGFRNTAVASLRILSERITELPGSSGGDISEDAFQQIKII